MLVFISINSCAGGSSAQSNAVVSQARSVVKTNSVEGGIDFLEAYLTKPDVNESNDLIVLTSLSSLYGAKGNYLKAEHYGRKAVSRNAKNGDANLVLANAMLGLGNWVEARKYAEVAYKRSSGKEEGNAALLLGQIAEIAAGLQETPEEGAVMAEQKILAGLTLIKKGEKVFGEQFLKKGLFRSKIPTAQRNRYLAIVAASGLSPATSRVSPEKRLIF